MGGERGNFRGRLFGGFDRRDVVSYIESLADERNRTAEENEKLRSRVEELEARLAECGAQDPLRESGTDGDGAEADAAPAASVPEKPEPKAAEPDAREEALRRAEEAVSELRKKYGAIRQDMEINVTHAECELSRVSGNFSGLALAFDEAGAKLEKLEKDIEDMKNKPEGA